MLSKFMLNSFVGPILLVLGKCLSKYSILLVMDVKKKKTNVKRLKVKNTQ